MVIIDHFKKYIIVAYANICLKKGIMQNIVLKFNKTLTLVI
jgi:hypothetical protein